VIKNFHIPHQWVVNYLYLFIFLVPWNFLKGQMGALTTVLVLLWIISFKQNGYWEKFKMMITSKPIILLFAFISYTYLSYFWSINMETYTTSQMFYKYFWFVIPLFFSILNRDEAIKGLKVLIISLGLYAVASICISFGLFEIGASTIDNPQVTLSYTISTPYMALTALMSYIIAFNENESRKKIFFYLLAFIGLIGLSINNGRAAQLGFVFTAIVLLATYFRKHLNIKIVSAFFLVIGLGFLILNSVGKSNRLKQGFHELMFYNDIEQLEGNWGCRLYMVHGSKNIIIKNPFVGTGAGDNIDQFIEWTKKHPNPRCDFIRSFHNQHLCYITKYGFLGYFLFIGSIIVLLYQLRKNKLVFGLGLAFFLFTAFDGIADIIILMKPYNYLFAVMFALLAITANDYKSSKRKEAL
jgi:O-antigen ligase